jgi:hypothetical protein
MGVIDVLLSIVAEVLNKSVEVVTLWHGDATVLVVTFKNSDLR